VVQIGARKGLAVTDVQHARPQLLDALVAPLPRFCIREVEGLAGHDIVDEQVADKEIPTGSISSFFKAREIAQVLKDWIQKGKFLLTDPVEKLPGKESGITFQAFRERPV